jgi:hypothetical protein
MASSKGVHVDTRCVWVAAAANVNNSLHTTRYKLFYIVLYTVTAAPSLPFVRSSPIVLALSVVLVPAVPSTVTALFPDYPARLLSLLSLVEPPDKTSHISPICPSPGPACAFHQFGIGCVYTRSSPSEPRYYSTFSL